MKPYRLGIVFSGGGVRGVAHAGVLKALEEHGIVPEVIAGASAGALVGALYAAGLSTTDIRDFFAGASPFKWQYYSHLKPGLIDAEQFRTDLENIFPHDSFEALLKPLYVVATDIVNGQSRIFHQGPLITPLLASAAYPVVFTPVTIDGIPHADGGILNNFPVEPLLPLCERIIGIYANPVFLRKFSKAELRSSLAIAERAYHLALHRDVSGKFKHCDLVICPEELGQFRTFDLNYIDEIYEIGYKAGKQRLKYLTV